MGSETGVTVRMPKVEAPTERTLEQALLVRLWSKGVRLKVEGKPGDSRIVWRRKKGSGAEVAPEERGLVEDRQATFRTMLRFDRDYAAELIRTSHGLVMRRYPLGRGCDLSPAQKFMDAAHDAIGREDMHGVWYCLDRYVEEALGICEGFRGKPELIERERAV